MHEPFRSNHYLFGKRAGSNLARRPRHFFLELRKRPRIGVHIDSEIDHQIPQTVFLLLSESPREVIETNAASPRFAPHFHFPLQHASDRLLDAMRRPYRLDDYRALVDFTRSAMPHAAIGCDVIVGFPGRKRC